jgi:hypothetical protein
MIHLANHLHSGNGEPMSLPGHAGQLRDQATYDQSRKGFRQQSFLMASKIGHQPIVQELCSEKGHQANSERDSQDKSERVRISPRPCTIRQYPWAAGG